MLQKEANLEHTSLNHFDFHPNVFIVPQNDLGCGGTLEVIHSSTLPNKASFKARPGCSAV